MAHPSIIDLIYPIGCYFETSDNGFDPNLQFGGTWTQDSKGRVTVGVDETDTDFNSAGKTGGEKRHTLLQKELPANFVYDFGNSNVWGAAVTNTTGYGYQDNSSAGAGNFNESHNNLQPYITVFRWHRTA